MDIFSWNLPDKAKLFNKCLACQYCLVKKQTKFTITFPTNDINPFSANPTHFFLIVISNVGVSYMLTPKYLIYT